MEQTEDDMRRKDDSFMRKIAVGVTIAITIQAGFSIYYAGSLANQVTNNTKALEMMATKMDTQLQTSSSIARVEVLVESLNSVMERLSGSLEKVQTEQQRRLQIVDRADRYLRKQGE